MDEMTQINQIWKNTHGVKPQEGRELLLVSKKKKTYYHFGLYNSGNDRVMITSPTGFPWQPFTNFDLWAYLDELLDISNQQEPANEQNHANSAKSSKDLQESVSEDLEQAAIDYDSCRPALYGEDDEGDYVEYIEVRKDAFIAGAQWQKEQMMKDAVEIKINRDTLYDLKPLIHERYLDYKIGQKVKIIILPSDNK